MTDETRVETVRAETGKVETGKVEAGKAEPGMGVIATLRPNPQGDVTFDRHELREILALYGRKVSEGEWRDYAIDFSREKAVFSIFRRASEFPLYRVEKSPKLARKQGAFSVVTATGLILKRGHELHRVIDVLDKKLKLVTT